MRTLCKRLALRDMSKGGMPDFSEIHPAGISLIRQNVLKEVIRTKRNANSLSPSLPIL